MLQVFKKGMVMNMGYIHVYCGNGKGKTTAALGLALRAAGAGMRVHIIQFLKGSETSELNSLKLIPNISICRCDKDYGFYINMTDDNKNLIRENHNKNIKDAINHIKNEKIDVLILDEFLDAYNNDLMDKDILDQILYLKNLEIEIVFTGRNPCDKIIKNADYVSVIKKSKHPYDNGINARKGIEY